jgi:abequosyltransferase
MQMRSIDTAANLASPPPKLSICISTLNRAKFLRTVLDSIIPQLTDECEVVVVDNASVDHTAQLFSEPPYSDSRVRYLRMETNNGLDRNFDRAVELAKGEYCWLMPDDDLLKPGAVAALLAALQSAPSAVLVNYEFRDFELAEVLQTRVLDFDQDRVYGPWELERMFVELGDFIRYIGAVAIKRNIWLGRRRDFYDGSVYAFVGIVYQEPFPGPVHVIAEPYVSYRFGNVKTFDPLVMEVALAKWPSLIASLPFAESSKRKLHSAHPWRHPYQLLYWRGNGHYSYSHYRRWVRHQIRSIGEKAIAVACAIFPRVLANLLLVACLSTRGRKLRQLSGYQLAALRKSRFYLFNWRFGKQPSIPTAVTPQST